MFRVVGLTEFTLHFGEVVVGNNHVFRTIGIQSDCTEDLIINLHASTVGQVIFRLEDKYDASHPTTESAQSFATFNLLGNTEEVRLPAQQMVYVSVGYYAPEDHANVQQPTSLKKERYHINEVKGLVTLRSRIAPVTTSGHSGTERSRTVITTPSDMMSYDMLHEVRCKLRAFVCKSIVRPLSSDVVFQRCFLGEVFIRDFSLWNYSEVSAHIRVSVFPEQPINEPKPVIRVLDYETSQPCNSWKIDGFSQVRICVAFAPRTVGEHKYTLYVENEQNEDNNEMINVYAGVTKQLKQAVIAVEVEGHDSGACEVDFGECHVGIKANRILMLTNLSNEDAFVVLGADIGEASGDVQFMLHNAMSEMASQNTAPGAGMTVASTSGGTVKQSSGGGSDEPKEMGHAIDKDTKRERPGQDVIEKVLIPAGRKRSIKVTFRPNRNDSVIVGEERRGMFEKRSFLLQLGVTSVRGEQIDNIKLATTARVCESIIQLHSREIDFGDCNISTIHHGIVKIFNASDIATSIKVLVSSSVVRFPRLEADIGPHQTIDISFEYRPRYVNPDYRKEVTIRNELNPDNDQLLVIRGYNMDRHRVTFHSVFYKIITPVRMNAVAFGRVAAFSPSIQTITFRNLTDYPLSLKLRVSSDDLLLFDGDKWPRRVYAKSDKTDMPTLDTVATLTDTPQTTEYSSRMSTLFKMTSNSSMVGRPSRDKDQKRSAKMRSKSLDREISHTIYALDAAMYIAKSDPSRCPSRYLLSIDLAMPSVLVGQILTPSASLAPPLSTTTSVMTPKFDSRLLPTDPPGVDVIGRVPPVVIGTREQPLLQGQFAFVFDESQPIPPIPTPSVSDRASDAKVTTRPRVITTALVNGYDRPVDMSILNLRDINDHMTLEQERDYAQDMQIARAAFDALVPRSSSNSPKPGSPRPGPLLYRVDTIRIPPKLEKKLVVVFIPGSSCLSSAPGQMTKAEAKILVHMHEFDRGIDPRTLIERSNPIPVREIPVTAKICKVKLDIVQKHLNLDHVTVGESYHRKVVVRNDSELLACYVVKKSGTTSSDDIRILQADIGVIPPYGTVEIPFVFIPTQEGRYEESIKIENIMDPSGSLMLSFKAMSTRVATFSIRSSRGLDFGNCQWGEESEKQQRIVIANCSKRRRTFDIRLDEIHITGYTGPRLAKGELDIEIWFSEVSVDQSTTGKQIREMEEELVGIEHKMRIAKRKQKTEKIKKLTKKLSRISTVMQLFESGDVAEPIPLLGDDTIDTPLAPTTVDDKTPDPWKRGVRTARLRKARLHSNTLTLTLPADELRSTIAFIIPYTTNRRILLAGRPVSIRGVIAVNEARNVDHIERLQFVANILPVEKNRAKTIIFSVLGIGDSTCRYRHHHHDTAEATARTQSLQPIEVSPSHVDLGNMIMSSASTLSLTLSASSPFSFVMLTGIDSMDADGADDADNKTSAPFGVTFDPPSGSGGSVPVVVKVTIAPRVAGKMSSTIIIRNTLSKIDTPVTVIGDVEIPQILEFPSLLQKDDSRTLDLGLCYVDVKKQVHKIHALMIKNVWQKAVTLTATCNLTHQVAIYADKQMTKIASDVSVSPGETSTIHVVIQGTYSENARQLLGGILISVSTLDVNGIPMVMTKEKIKLIAIVGPSIIKLSCTTLDMASVRWVGRRPIGGSFEVSNKSNLLPAHVAVRASPCVILPDTSLVLAPTGNHGIGYSGNVDDGSDDDGQDKEKPSERVYGRNDVFLHGKSSYIVRFKIIPSSPGLYFFTIFLTNLHNSEQEDVQVRVRVMVDVDALAIDGSSLDSAVSHMRPLIGTTSRELPSLSFGSVPVYVHDFGAGIASPTGSPDAILMPAKSTVRGRRPKYYKTFMVRNVSDRTLLLRMRSNLHGLTAVFSMATARADDVSAPVTMAFPQQSDLWDLERFHVCSGVVLLNPYKTFTVTLTPPYPPPAPSKKLELMHSGKPWYFNGSVIIESLPFTPELARDTPGAANSSTLPHLLTINIDGLDEPLNSSALQATLQKMPEAQAVQSATVLSVLDVRGYYGFPSMHVDPEVQSYRTRMGERFMVTYMIRNDGALDVECGVGPVPCVGGEPLMFVLLEDSFEKLVSMCEGRNPYDATAADVSTALKQGAVFSEDSPERFTVSSMQHVVVHVIVRTEILSDKSAQKYSYDIPVINHLNPSGGSSMKLSLEVTGPGVHVGRCLNDDDFYERYQCDRVDSVRTSVSTPTNRNENYYNIMLPTLEYPDDIDKRKPKEDWFSLQNMCDMMFNLSLFSSIDGCVAPLVALECVNRSNNSIMPDHVTLDPHEGLGVRVRLRLMSTHLTPAAVEMMKNAHDKAINWGKIVLKSSFRSDIIRVWACVRTNTSFVVSPSQLELSGMVRSHTLTKFSRKEFASPKHDGRITIGKQTVMITNTTDSVPLHLALSVVNDHGTVVESVHIEPTNIVVAPHTSGMAMVSAMYGTLVHALRLVVTDDRWPLSCTTVPIVKGDDKGQKSDDRIHPKASLDTLKSDSEMRKIGSNVFAVNSGRLQVLGARALQPNNDDPWWRRIVADIEGNPWGVNPFAGCFVIDLGQQDLTSEGVTWELRIKNDSSLLPLQFSIYSLNQDRWMSMSTHGGDVPPNEAMPVTLKIMTNTLGVRYTHVLIENVHDPTDVKIVRIMMEVVQRHSLRDPPFFTLYTAGMPVPRHAKAIIDYSDVYYGQLYRHRSFLIQNERDTALDYVLTSSLPKDARTELVFSLSSSVMRLFKTTITIGPHRARKIYVFFRPQPDGDGSDVKSIDIFVRARLLRDYHQIIKIRAKCNRAHLDVKPAAHIFLFDATVNENIEFTPSQSSLTIGNVSESGVLRYAIINDSRYFLVDGPAVGVLEPAEQSMIKLSVNKSAVVSDYQKIARERYIEEHITVYNVESPRDRYWVRVRLSCGVMKLAFAQIAGTGTAYAFEVLELRILSFLQAFGLFTSNLALGRSRSSSVSVEKFGDESDSVSQTSENIADIDDSLYYSYHYLTDELIWYAANGFSGSVIFKLAKLLFLCVFHQPVFGPLISVLEEYSEDPGKGIPSYIDMEGDTVSQNVLESLARRLKAIPRNLIPSWTAKFLLRVMDFIDTFPDTMQELGELYSLFRILHCYDTLYEGTREETLKSLLVDAVN